MVGKNSRCLVCGSRVRAELQGLFDTRFGIERIWNVWRCADCGTEQTLPMPSPGELKQLYEEYYNFGAEKETRYTRVRERFLTSPVYRIWLAIDGDISFHGIKGSGRLLDIGCNEGRGLQIYQCNGFNAEGLELNEQAAQQARGNGCRVNTVLLEDFQPEEPFDIVALSNVLEHSLNPKRMLEDIGRVLKPGGRVWISLPNSNSWLRKVFGRFWINWHVPFHLFHFSRKTLSQLLERCGFEITEIKYATPSHWVSQSILAAIFARPGRQTPQLRSPILVAALMMFCRFVLFPLLWVGNLTGRGDCLVVVAKKSTDYPG